jgi:hypothetical protein
VGGPHIGKSSIIHYITNERVRSDYLPELARRCVFIDIACEEFSSVQNQPHDIWERVWDKTLHTCSDDSVHRHLLSLQHAMAVSFSLRRLVDGFARHNWRLVLILEDIHVWLQHPNLNSSDVFGAFRSLHAHPAFVLVVTSRLSVTEMNERLTALSGSPLLNHLIDVRLPAFQPQEVAALLTKNLQQTSVEFSPEDTAYLRRIAGRHPYLVQATSAGIFEAITHNITRSERYREVGRRLQEQVSNYFDAQWRHLNAQEQKALLILLLGEAPRLAHSHEASSFQVFQTQNPYQPELEQLTRMGLVIQDGSTWRIGAESFVYWIVTSIIGSSLQSLTFEQWMIHLERNGYVKRDDGKRWDVLKDRIHPEFFLKTAELLGAVLKGVLS